MKMTKNAKPSVIGIAVGIINGVFGAGGGTLLVPALERFMGIEAHKAHATAVAVILPLCAVSALVYLWQGQTDWSAVMWVSLGGVAGGALGANLLSKLPAKWLHRLFAVFLAAAAIRMIFQTTGGTGAEAQLQNSEAVSGAALSLAWLWYTLTGFAAGILSGMGIGGGAILIPALGLLLSVGQKEAQHINLLYFLPTATIAVITHQKKGNIEKEGLGKLIFFGLIGAAAGAFIAVQTDAGILRKGFGFFLLATAFFEFKKSLKKEQEKGTAQ